MLKFYSGKLVSEWDALQAASVMQVEYGHLIEGAKYGARSALKSVAVCACSTGAAGGFDD